MQANWLHCKHVPRLLLFGYNAYMILRYQTGIATLVQFIAMGLLNIGNTGNAIATACREETGSCSTDIFVSIIFYLLLMSWFGIMCLLGYMAQERRSRRFAIVLIGAELLTIGVASINARGHTDVLSLITSIVDIILAFLVIYLAVRIILAGRGRVTRQRQRRRRSTAPSVHD